MDGDLFRGFVDDLGYGVFVVDGERRIRYWNRAASALAGYTAEETVGKLCCDSIMRAVDEEGKSICSDSCPVEEALRTGERHEIELMVHHKDGHRVPVTVMATPRGEGAGSDRPGAVIVMQDNARLAAARQRIEELETLSLIDPLTKLGNRLYLEMNLQARLHELRRYGWTSGMLFIDVDNFKNVNDSHGHDVGDQLLVRLAHALQTQSRPFDVVGRWAGDEFCVIVVHATAEQLKLIAERYRQAVEDTTLQIGSKIVKITVSIGATLAKAGDTVDTLYRRADQLMYQSKSAGRNCVSMDAAT